MPTLLNTIPLLSINNNLDYSILTPDEGRGEALSILLPVLSDNAFPPNSFDGDELRLCASIDDTQRVLSWVGVDETTYQLDLGRVDLEEIIAKRSLNEVELYCVVISALTGDVTAMGEIIITN